MTMAERYFDPRILGSITSGVMLMDGFSKVHEAMEFLAGHPVWTHEIPSVSRAVAPAILARYPDMPAEPMGNWQAAAAALVAKYGDAIPVAPGDGERDRSPLNTLADMVGPEKVIVIAKDE